MARKRRESDSAGAAARSGRKRARGAATDASPQQEGQQDAEVEAADVSGETADPGPSSQAPADGGVADTRREQMAAIARQRAAHFAHFQAEEEDQDADNAHVGGTEARNLGPWSSARQLVEAREQAKASRADRQKSKAAAGVPVSPAKVSWSPSRDPKQAQPGPERVAPLTGMLLRLLTDHIQDVESLWGLPDVLRVKLAAAVAERRKLTPEAARLFSEGLPGEVVLPDCTQLEEPHMSALLSECASHRLERLDLRQCGRGMGKAAAGALCSKASSTATGAALPALSFLALAGAYRVTDEALEGILRQAPNLTELRLPNCSRLEGSILHALPSLVPSLRVLDLSNCRGIGSEALRASLARASGTGAGGLPHLHTLSLQGLRELSDQLLSDIALALPQLRSLDLRLCAAISDTGLRGVGAACPQLTRLVLDDVGRVTDAGLLSVAECCMSLEEISLARCQKITDAPIVAMAANRKLRSLCCNNVFAITDATVVALASACCESLVEVNLSWCRGVTSRALGMLADACPGLTCLTLYGCTQIDTTFLQGHSNANLKVAGAPNQKVSVPDLARAELIGSAED
ncbi:hypothetical protein WJX73_008709 [Symbiochloris irregularis]|uniref:F-box/LRR-repeat protein 15-like leucin rich repeat domain-containing protein n=1 Tax=Symbiochloris irregularis TaxID=706552 RepID=A0AAW1NU80_9CHLO